MGCARFRSEPQRYSELLMDVAEEFSDNPLQAEHQRMLARKLRRNAEKNPHLDWMTEAMDGFICGDGIKTCVGCAQPADFLCDAPTGEDFDPVMGTQTCDAPICDNCRVNVGHEKDLCPQHQSSMRRPKKG